MLGGMHKELAILTKKGGFSYLEGYDFVYQITIDSDKVDEDLYNFPLLIPLSSSAGIGNNDVTPIFDELGANSKKIAVTTSDGTTQCYVEIENWNNGSEQAWLWTRVPFISSTEDTILYLYYDSTADDNAYVGNTLEAAAKEVWDSDFVCVYHFDNESESSDYDCYDSTRYLQHGRSMGLLTQHPIVLPGHIGNAYNFDGDAQRERVEIPDVYSDFVPVTEVTMECIPLADGIGNDSMISSYSDDGLSLYLRYSYESTYHRLDGWVNGGTFNPVSTTEYTIFSTYRHLCTTGIHSDVHSFFVDGTFIGSDVCASFEEGPYGRMIGTEFDEGTLFFNGKIDEYRLSKVARSRSWVKATYFTCFDNLITFTQL